MLLNAGCGEHYAAGWVNTDLHRDGPCPDIICSLTELPFPDSSCERVYCGHVLEHIVPADLPRALAEIRRVLIPEGKLLIVGPDIELTRQHEPVLEIGVIFGGRRWPGDEHKWAATGWRTLRYLRAAGLTALLIPVADVGEKWPIVDRAPWQFAITATHEGAF